MSKTKEIIPTTFKELIEIVYAEAKEIDPKAILEEYRQALAEIFVLTAKAKAVGLTEDGRSRNAYKTMVKYGVQDIYGGSNYQILEDGSKAPALGVDFIEAMMRVAVTMSFNNKPVASRPSPETFREAVRKASLKMISEGRITSPSG